MSLEISDRDLDFNKWKVADLRKELKSRGLSVEGKKNELVERLQLAMGDSALLEDTNDQDEILDDILTDDEPFEESELVKPDTPEKDIGKSKTELELKTKPAESSESNVKPPKKIILNRNASLIDATFTKTEGKENKEQTNSETTGTKTAVTKVDALSPQERLERRKAKFGAVESNDAKKEARAARFGLPTASGKMGGSVNTNIDVLKKRAERFGTTLPGSILESAEIEEKRKKREERFGKVETITTSFTRGKYSQSSSTLEEKKRLRAQRFKMK